MKMLGKETGLYVIAYKQALHNKTGAKFDRNGKDWLLTVGIHGYAAGIGYMPK